LGGEEYDDWPVRPHDRADGLGRLPGQACGAGGSDVVEPAGEQGLVEAVADMLLWLSDAEIDGPFVLMLVRSAARPAAPMVVAAVPRIGTAVALSSVYQRTCMIQSEAGLSYLTK
jgi:hypothetical protein